MGQALDREGHVLGEAFGRTKQEVFDKLLKKHGDEAHEIRVKMLDGASTEMPRYQSHKQVWALKIASIVYDSDVATRENRETDGSAVLHVEGPYASLRVDSAYVRKHDPQPGGYFVVYEDGYRSWSPAAAFEKGYTRL